jgi:hypothetical protein
MREEIKKPASELAGCNETLNQLEPEHATEVEAAAGCQVRSGDRIAGQLRNSKCASKVTSACAFDVRINGCEVSVIEGIQCAEAEFERCPLIELDAFGHTSVQVIKRCVTANVAGRVAKWRTENGLGNAAVGNVAHLFVANCHWHVCFGIKRRVRVVLSRTDIVKANQSLVSEPACTKRSDTYQCCWYKFGASITLEHTYAINRGGIAAQERPRRR